MVPNPGDSPNESTLLTNQSKRGSKLDDRMDEQGWVIFSIALGQLSIGKVP